MDSIICIKDLSKTYKSGLTALKNVSLDINEGEIFALLGPNGAGKTTLISMTCGLSTISSGQILVGNCDVASEPIQTRKLIGLVPQELTINMFETVWDSVCFSRGVFGLESNDSYIEQLLKSLSLLDKKNSPLMTLSGGMKRRVMIAKALAHEPKVLFLDEPTAGVDVELRRDMWAQIRNLKASGVTIILTTHYIEEAEEMADRIGVIRKGELIEVEEKHTLIKKLGKKNVTFELEERLDSVPHELESFDITLSNGHLQYNFNSKESTTNLNEVVVVLNKLGLKFRDIHSKESSLEDIFLELVHEGDK